MLGNMKAGIGMTGIAAVVAFACSPGPKTNLAPARTVLASRHSSPLSASIDQHCAVCHSSGEPGKPSLTGENLGRDVLYRAAILVAAERMPPLPAKLGVEERNQLVTMLCSKAAPLEECPALRAAGEEGPPVLLGEEYLVVARELVPRDAGFQAPAEGLIEGYRVANVQGLDVTYLIHEAVLAAQRCPAPSVADAGPFRTCANLLIDPPRGRVPGVGPQ